MPSAAWGLGPHGRILPAAGHIHLRRQRALIRSFTGLSILGEGFAGGGPGTLVRGKNTKFIPVTFEGSSPADVPDRLRNYTRYEVPKQFDYL
jgi:hypothetical protein